MSQAEILIKPRMVGNAAAKLSELARQARAAGAAQVDGLRAAVTSADKLEGAYDRVGGSLGRLKSGVGGLLGQVASLQSLALGFATAGAGKTIFEAMIGSNAALEQQTTTFRTMIGDAGKAADAITRVRKYAAETPFGEAELIEGSKRLLRLTGQNVDENIRLLKVAAQLKAIAPSKSLEDAVEALLDAEGNEFERLKEFGIKLKAEDVKKSKKSGEALGRAALRGVEEQLNKMTGGRDVVAALSQTFTGKVSTLKDNIANTLRIAGEPAFEVLKRGIDDVSADFSKLQADPQFKQDLKDLSFFASDMARASVELVRALPGAINQARRFITENQTLLGVAGGAFAANKLTGGALGAVAMAGGRRALFGRGAGGAGAGPLGAAAAGATPVFVVNWDGQGGLAGAVGDALGGAAGKAAGGGAAATGARGLLGSLASKGVVGTLGAGPSLVVAGGAAFLGAQLYTLGQVTRGSTRALEGFERRAEEAERAEREVAKKRREAAMRDLTRPLSERAAQERAGRLSGASTMLGLGQFDKAKGELLWEYEREARGKEKKAQAAWLKTTNAELLRHGVEASVGRDGQLIFAGGLVGGEFDLYQKLKTGNAKLSRRFGDRFTQSAQGQRLLAEEARLRQKGEAAAARARALNASAAEPTQQLGLPELAAIGQSLMSGAKQTGESLRKTFNIQINAAQMRPDELELMMRRLLRDLERESAQTSPGGF
jgi:hypothetical protein